MKQIYFCIKKLKHMLYNIKIDLLKCNEFKVESKSLPQEAINGIRNSILYEHFVWYIRFHTGKLI